MNHYLLSFWACWGISDHTHLKQPTNNICCFHRPLVTSKNSVSYLNLFLRYSSLKNTVFWLVQRFLDNWRTRFLPNILFLEKVKTPLALSYWSKKRIIGSSYRKLAWVGFEPTTTLFRSEPTLHSYSNFIVCSVSDFTLSVAFVSHHVYFNQNIYIRIYKIYIRMYTTDFAN